MRKKKYIIWWKWITWGMIVFIGLFFIEGTRQTMHYHKAQINYVINSEGYIDWKETYEDIKEELGLHEEEDFYMFIMDRDSRKDYDNLQADFFTHLSVSADQIFGKFDIMVHKKNDKFYRYNIYFDSAHIEIENYTPKLYGGFKYKFIKEDPLVMGEKCAGGKLIFDVLHRKIPECKPQFQWNLNEITTDITFFYEKIESDVSFEREKIYLVKDKEIISVKDKTLDSGWYFEIGVFEKSSNEVEMYLYKLSN